MAEASPGKDSVTGHWELMGLVLERPFRVFPGGFPAGVIEQFSRTTGRAAIGNKAASGTAIIDELGPEHLRTGALIVYTSADSVFQIAAHEDVVPLPELYDACRTAYRLVVEGLGHGARDRAAVCRSAGIVQAHGQPPGLCACRRLATRCSTG